MGITKKSQAIDRTQIDRFKHEGYNRGALSPSPPSLAMGDGMNKDKRSGENNGKHPQEIC
jgi:hypothetical protein